jgi:acyl carrier protein phosphodiesterase
LNWLAHVLLSERDIEHQLGNILADPLKGKAWEGASEQIVRGIMLHKHIDRFTDAHPLVKRSKALLTPRGHLKGVVLDILYDHFLSLHWNRYCTISREPFLDAFREAALDVVSGYPPEAQNIIRRVIGNRQLGSYIHMDGVVSAFRRIDARLSVRARGKDNMARYIPLIAEQRELLERDFLDFFPELMYELKHHSQAEVNHWKI